VAVGQNGPTVRIDPYRYDYAPEFYAFMARWPNPDGHPLIGYFAVNPWTGDVWDVMGCRRIVSPELEKEQDAIWARSPLRTEARSVLREKSPGCLDRDQKAQKRGARMCTIRREAGGADVHGRDGVLCVRDWGAEVGDGDVRISHGDGWDGEVGVHVGV